MTARPIVLILTLIPLFTSLGCDRSGILKESRLIMDTIVNISLPSSQDAHKNGVIQKAFRKMEELESLVSKYNRESEIALINRLKVDDKILLSDETFSVLKKAIDLSEMTQGAFDITISPLVDLWSSYKESDTIPGRDEVERARLKVGYKNIILDANGHLRLASEDTDIDLSGIAKGYVVDEATKILKENGVKSGLIDAGGDIYCFGAGPSKKGWRIGIRNPREASLLGTLTLSDKAVATSGDYQRFYIKKKTRYSHIIDPRSGYPVSELPMSVTVIAPDCATADGLATAISVMGPRDGLRLAEELKDIEAIIVSKDDDFLKIDFTSGAREFYDQP
jgi:thiamine biosynthesis lipoprotein